MQFHARAEIRDVRKSWGAFSDTFPFFLPRTKCSPSRNDTSAVSIKNFGPFQTIAINTPSFGKGGGGQDVGAQSPAHPWKRNSDCLDVAH